MKSRRSGVAAGVPEADSVAVAGVAGFPAQAGRTWTAEAGFAPAEADPGSVVAVPDGAVVLAGTVGVAVVVPGDSAAAAVVVVGAIVPAVKATAVAFVPVAVRLVVSGYRFVS